MSEDRLYKNIDSLFEMISELQKELFNLDGNLGKHLSESDVRLDLWNKNFERINKKLDEFEKFKTVYEAKKKGIVSVGTVFKWSLGVLVTIIALWEKIFAIFPTSSN